MRADVGLRQGLKQHRRDKGIHGKLGQKRDAFTLYDLDVRKKETAQDRQKDRSNFSDDQIKHVSPKGENKHQSPEQRNRSGNPRRSRTKKGQHH
ncbi:hypothetical protein GCM10009100_28080 [Thalassospira tepidiphila]